MLAGYSKKDCCQSEVCHRDKASLYEIKNLSVSGLNPKKIILSAPEYVEYTLLSSVGTHRFKAPFCPQLELIIGLKYVNFLFYSNTICQLHRLILMRDR
jgi:hypothetical protein